MDNKKAKKKSQMSEELFSEHAVEKFVMDNAYNSTYGAKQSLKNNIGSPFKCLKNHITSVHEGNRPLKCDTCETKFSEKGILDMHVNSVHEKKKPFKCNLKVT